MSLFSQRAGLKPANKSIQRGSIDLETRNALWSILHGFYELHDAESRNYHSYGPTYPFREKLKLIAIQYWMGYFKYASDTVPNFSDMVAHCRKYFYKCEWNEVLDFLDFTVQQIDEPKIMIREINGVFEKECCAYRFVGGMVTELTTTAEIDAIDNALSHTTKSVSSHLEKALKFLSDRKKPDYHNSIKESVSAMEAAGRQLTKKNDATLSDAIKSLKAGNSVHPALLNSLTSLYGYAGDEGGVRHANKENGRDVSQAEAMLILVLSSAVCGFLASKQN